MGLGETDVVELLREVWALFGSRRRRRERERREALLEPPWNVLVRTGNGIGRAPASLRCLPSLDDDGFEDLHLGELLDCFWHQGTIYAATPFAVQEVLAVLMQTPRTRHEALLDWIRLCLESERVGDAPTGSHAGIWVPAKTRELLETHRLSRPTVAEVVRRSSDVIAQVRDDSERDQATRSLAGAVLGRDRG